MTSFEDLDLNDRLLNVIGEMGFDEPTQIQAESIPHIIAGKDVIGESATGSGKTLAFGCGIVTHTVFKHGIQALVLTPTRELAEQVKDSLRELTGKNPLGIIAIYGGASIHNQIKNLKKADVVIATPGRLLDHIRRRTIDLSGVKLLVLDEADRMFDMGFIDDVETIIKQCSKKRQTLFFSATISSRVNSLAYRHMEDPVKVYAEKMVKPELLEQVYYDVPKSLKLSLLTHLLNTEESTLCMVFCNTRRTVDFVTRNLRAHRIHAVAIHGGLSQKMRNKTIDLFNRAKEEVLVCTDVAARGLHIENVSHIYNYDSPIIPNDYVHRIGRTARAGEEGKVINLLSKLDQQSFNKIQHRYPKFTITNISRPKIKQLDIISTERGTGRRRSHDHGKGKAKGPRKHHPDSFEKKPKHHSPYRQKVQQPGEEKPTHKPHLHQGNMNNTGYKPRFELKKRPKKKPGVKMPDLHGKKSYSAPVDPDEKSKVYMPLHKRKKITGDKKFYYRNRNYQKKKK